MNCLNRTKSTLVFSSVNDIPENIWIQLQCSANLYFDSKYLKAIEQYHQNLTFYYLVILDETQSAIALTSIQLLDFYIDAIENNLQSIVKRIAHFARKLKILPKEKPLKILICGNTFVSGEHGIFIKEGQDKKQVLKSIAKEVQKIVPSKDSIDIYVIKDFVKASLEITNELQKQNFYPFQVEPNMKFSFNSDWKHFDDYLDALKTKFRVKAKKAISLSKDLSVENVTQENIDLLLPKMTELYKTVSNKSSFNLETFNLEAYQALKNNLGDRLLLKTYALNGQLVGFMSGLINHNTLDAHFVGIDYRFNKSHAVYQRMLYDYIETGIDKNLQTLNFGRTASEIKSSVGASPEHLTIYIKHKKSITNKIIKLFLSRIQPTEFNQKNPFKKTSIENR